MFIETRYNKIPSLTLYVSTLLHALRADIHRIDPETCAVDRLSAGPNKGDNRVYHTATLLGDHKLWVIGGMRRTKTIAPYSETRFFDLRTRTWRTPTLRGSVSLLQRMGHCAVRHPHNPDAILIFGGYAFEGSVKSNEEWLNDVVLLDTKSLEVRELVPTGPAPIPRAHHAVATFGSLCCILFGRKSSKKVVESSEAIEIYDSKENRWYGNHEYEVHGPEPPLRSNLMASSMPWGIILSGGILSIPKDSPYYEKLLSSSSKGNENALSLDVHVLQIKQNSRQDCSRFLNLSWKSCGDCSNETASKMPNWRMSHGQFYRDEKLYVFGGYQPRKTVREYDSSFWTMNMDHMSIAKSTLQASTPLSGAQKKRVGQEENLNKDVKRCTKSAPPSKKRKTSNPFSENPRGLSNARNRETGRGAEDIFRNRSLCAPDPLSTGKQENSTMNAPCTQVGAQKESGRHDAMKKSDMSCSEPSGSKEETLASALELMKAKFEDVNRERMQLKQQNIELKSKAESVLKELDKSRKEIQILKNEATLRLASVENKLRDELTFRERLHRTAISRLQQDMEDRAKKVEATAAALQSRVDSEVKRNSGLARIVKVLQDQLATEQTARQDLVKNHDSMQEKVSDLGKMLQKSKEETEKLEKKLAEKERSESALVAEKTAVESGKRQIEQKLLEAEREILKLKARS